MEHRANPQAASQLEIPRFWTPPRVIVRQQFAYAEIEVSSFPKCCQPFVDSPNGRG